MVTLYEYFNFVVSDLLNPSSSMSACMKAPGLSTVKVGQLASSCFAEWIQSSLFFVRNMRYCMAPFSLLIGHCRWFSWLHNLSVMTLIEFYNRGVNSFCSKLFETFLNHAVSSLYAQELYVDVTKSCGRLGMSLPITVCNFLTKTVRE